MPAAVAGLADQAHGRGEAEFTGAAEQELGVLTAQGVRAGAVLGVEIVTQVGFALAAQGLQGLEPEGGGAAVFLAGGEPLVLGLQGLTQGLQFVGVRGLRCSRGSRTGSS